MIELAELVKEVLTYSHEASRCVLIFHLSFHFF